MSTAEESSMEHDGNPQAQTSQFSTVGTQVTEIESGEGEGKLVEEIESLCMQCGKNGTTKLLLTMIPFFREIVLMSFYCPNCDFRNSEVQAASEIQKLGAKYSLKLESLTDFKRQIVKSDTAIIKIEEINLEIPPGRGRMTNVEGILSEVKEDLSKDQPLRQAQDEDLYHKLEDVVQKLYKMLNGESFPFTITLDDPAGNSSLEPSPGEGRGKFHKDEYMRSPQQNISLGMERDSEDDAETANGSHPNPDPSEITMEGMNLLDGESATMPCPCPGCSRPAHMNMQMVNIPYFKQVLITAVSCSYCGYRTSEVKTGGEIPDKGKKIWLDVRNARDLHRDILKSETCALHVPECSVEVQPGTMGGRFTTLEGLLTQIRDDLRNSIFDTNNEGGSGDSMPQDQKVAWGRFFATLDKALKVEIPFTVLLQDPLAGSYVQSYAAPEPDPQIRMEEYTRSEEEDEDLGLKDMKTHRNEDGEYVKANADQS